VYSDEVVSYVL